MKYTNQNVHNTVFSTYLRLLAGMQREEVEEDGLYEEKVILARRIQSFLFDLYSTQNY